MLSFLENSKQYLIHGTQALQQYESKKLSEKDLNELYQNIKLLPNDVECLIFSGDSNEILFSTIPDFSTDTIISTTQLWDYMKNTSDNFFYQFTAPIIYDNKGLLITRIPKNNHLPEKRRSLFKHSMFFLSLIVFICLILILIISKTIFTSIMEIKNKTQKLAEGNISEKIISDKDITKANEITTILESVEQMRLSILDLINRKSMFIMGISHDLRTPVAIIKGYSEAISDGIISSPEEIKNSIELIEQRASELSELIDSLLSYIKLNEIEIREKLTPGPIVTIIQDFAKSSIISANVFKRNIKSNIYLPDDIYIPLNEQLVLRSFENLFSNALRYTKDNDTIEINSYMDNNNIIFIIKDTGIGIAEKDLENIFDIFYRGTNSRKEDGYGIGLTVVKNIIDTHGWKISVSSKKGKGSSFQITIPIK